MENSNFESLDKWLNTHGIGLELQVAGAFKKKYSNDQLFTVIQHSYQYLDTKSEDGEGVLRETDVIITKSKRINHELTVSIRLVIECKYGSGMPLVLYKENSQLPKFNFDPIEEIWTCQKTAGIDTQNLGGVYDNKIFARGLDKTCYSIETINLDGKVNSKFSAQNSIKQLASGLAGVQKQTIHDPQTKSSIQILIPILLTKSPIYTLSLGEDGEILKEESLRELLIWRTDPTQDGSKAFWVMHFNALEGFIEEFDQFFQEADFRDS